jgi:hypothetical protein
MRLPLRCFVMFRRRRAPSSPPPGKRRWQYSLRALFAMVFVVALLCSWLGVRMQAARRQREALAALADYGTIVKYDYQEQGEDEPPGPEWLRRLLGEDFFASVRSVEFGHPDLIKGLGFSGELPVLRDDTLKNLESLPKLRSLSLSYQPGITDAGLVHLRGLQELEELDLSSTAVGDGGLEHLGQLAQLRNLHISATRVTDAGLAKIQGLTHLRVLSVSGKKITDRGLSCICSLSSLEELCIVAPGYPTTAWPRSAAFRDCGPFMSFQRR